MAPNGSVHVISKKDDSKHHLVQITIESLPPLAPSSIRAKTALVSLGSNNLAYARMGTIFHWWDAFPVPSSVPSPYNDRSQYGVVPVWGYAKVLESNVPAFEQGMLVWGYWASHDVPVDLKLVPREPGRHWTEVSEHRQELMPLYNHYIVRDPALRLEGVGRQHLESLAYETLFRPVWEAGYLLSKSVFGSPPIHPLGVGEWSESDADLSKAIVISLSAAGKTSRAFTEHLINGRSAATQPLGFVAITTITENLVPKASFPTKTVSYAQSTDASMIDFITGLKPAKVIVNDFGGRGNSLQKLLKALEPHFAEEQIVIVGIGGEMKGQSADQLGASLAQSRAHKNRVQMNTSPIRYTAIEHVGAEKYFANLARGWQDFVEHGGMDGVKLDLKEGMQAIDSGWQSLCDSKVPADVGLVVKL